MSSYNLFRSIFDPHCSIFIYFNFVGLGEYLLTVDFKSSLSKAVLKLYPAVDETQRASVVCLSFSVDFISSKAVQLLVAVSNISEDNTDLPSDSSVISDRRQVGRGRHSVSVLSGRQYVVLIATKIKVTGMSDTVRISRVWRFERPCTDSACK